MPTDQGGLTPEKLDAALARDHSAIPWDRKLAEDVAPPLPEPSWEIYSPRGASAAKWAEDAATYEAAEAAIAKLVAEQMLDNAARPAGDEATLVIRRAGIVQQQAEPPRTTTKVRIKRVLDATRPRAHSHGSRVGSRRHSAPTARRIFRRFRVSRRTSMGAR